MKLPSICPYCRRIVPARQVCECRPKRQVDEQQRNSKQPYRDAYRDPTYIRNRALRYRMVGGLCENCHAEIKGELHPDGRAWQCHHVVAASRFTDPRQANAIENLRCYCEKCHRGQRKPR